MNGPKDSYLGNSQFKLAPKLFVFSFLVDKTGVREAIRHYKKGGDFADLLIVVQAPKHQAKRFFSFDNQLQKMFPNYVTGKVPKVAF